MRNHTCTPQRKGGNPTERADRAATVMSETIPAQIPAQKVTFSAISTYRVPRSLLTFTTAHRVG